MDFELWFYSYFGMILGLIVGWFYAVFLAHDCRMVLCRVFGMFCAVFVACFVASIGRIMWPMDKGCFGMVSGQNWHVSELPRSSLHAGAWKPCYCMAGLKIAALEYAIAWVSMQLRGCPCNCVAPTHLQTSNFGRP